MPTDAFLAVFFPTTRELWGPLSVTWAIMMLTRHSQSRGRNRSTRVQLMVFFFSALVKIFVLFLFFLMINHYLVYMDVYIIVY